MFTVKERKLQGTQGNPRKYTVKIEQYYHIINK